MQSKKQNSRKLKGIKLNYSDEDCSSSHLYSRLVLLLLLQLESVESAARRGRSSLRRIAPRWTAHHRLLLLLLLWASHHRTSTRLHHGLAHHTRLLHHHVGRLLTHHHIRVLLTHHHIRMLLTHHHTLVLLTHHHIRMLLTQYNIRRVLLAHHHIIRLLRLTMGSTTHHRLMTRSSSAHRAPKTHGEWSAIPYLRNGLAMF